MIISSLCNCAHFSRHQAELNIVAPDLKTTVAMEWAIFPPPYLGQSGVSDWKTQEIKQGVAAAADAVPLCIKMSKVWNDVTLDPGGKNVRWTLFGLGPYQLFTSI